MGDFSVAFLTEHGERACRILIMLIWLVAAFSFWRHKVIPRANQALAGSLAIVLSHGLVVYQVEIPFEVLLFFLACAQAVVVNAFLNIMRDFRRHLRACEACPHSPASPEVNHV